MTVEEAKIMKTQNKAYVSMRYAMDKKKAEKLQNGLHFIGAKVVAWYCVAGLFVFGFVFGFVFVFVPVSSFSSFDRFFVFGCIWHGHNLHAVHVALISLRIFVYTGWKAHNSHTLFFEDEAEAEQFQAAPHEHFDTVPELMQTSYNRVRKVTLTLTPGLTPALTLTLNPNPKP